MQVGRPRATRRPPRLPPQSPRLQRGRWGWLGCLPFLLASCSPGSLTTEPGDSGPEADAAPDAAPDGGAFPEVVESIIEAIDDANSVRCGCGWERFGYESVEECTSNLAISEMVRGCFGDAYLEHESDVSLHFDCRLVGERARLACLSAADCVNETMQDCQEDYAAFLDACPTIEAAASLRYEATLETCITGPPSGCPDFTRDASTATYSGRTEGGGNDLSGSCGGELGADHAHLWAAPATATFTIDTERSGFDTVLYVLTSCAGGEELACNDDIDTAAGNHASRIELDLEEGQEVVIVVDGWGYADIGAYELRIAQSGS